MSYAIYFRRRAKMKKRAFILAGGAFVVALATAAFAIRARDASAANDPRQEPPLVSLAPPAPVTGVEHGFTGVIGAKVQSNVGFRVVGKIVQRLVDPGQHVNAGQPLMRIDETDLRLALTAKRNAIAMARASISTLGAARTPTPSSPASKSIP